MNEKEKEIRLFPIESERNDNRKGDITRGKISVKFRRQ